MIKNIQLSDTKAREIYQSASPEIKKLLEENFDRKTLVGNVIDRIKTFADVESEVGIVEVPFSYPVTKQQRSINAFVRIQALAKALNEGGEPDFSNTSEYKWYPYFQKTSSGWVFHGSRYHHWITGMGSGFYFKSKELSNYAATQFLDLYKQYLPE